MIVLDTNVVSELMRPEPDVRVVSWLDAQRTPELYITAVTVAELLFRVERMPEGRRRREIASAITDTLERDFADGVLPFDASAALEYSRIVAHRERLGRRMGMADAMIVAVAFAAGASLLATRNVADFTDAGLSILDPGDT